jgi:predicted AAA+ superfamily ATPase
MSNDLSKLENIFARITKALENQAQEKTAGAKPHGSTSAALAKADAFVWEAEGGELIPIVKVAHLPLSLLKGIERQRDTLVENTKRFADGLPANNALLWGARGMGKSSLIKSVHAAVNAERKDHKLALIEIPREDISTLPQLLRRLRGEQRQILLFCDDLSFDKDDTSYKSLKAALEGGVEGRPINVLFYATSNRRHLMPRDMVENERSTSINPSETVEEKVSLSDRFGLWLGFHNCTQDEYLTMIHGYVAHFSLEISGKELNARALSWAATRGSRSGRVAWQFIQDLAGSLGAKIA